VAKTQIKKKTRKEMRKNSVRWSAANKKTVIFVSNSLANCPRPTFADSSRRLSPPFTSILATKPASPTSPPALMHSLQINIAVFLSLLFLRLLWQ